MSRDVRQRIEDFETAIHSLVPASSTDEELIAAGVSGTLTPPQAAQLFDIAGEHIRFQVIVLAALRYNHRVETGEEPWDSWDHPVGWAATTLSCPVEVDLKHPFDHEDWPYDPDFWVRARLALTTTCARWARFYFLHRVLGPDGGLSFRKTLDECRETGILHIDGDLYPDVRTYRLLHPIGWQWNHGDELLLRHPTRPSRLRWTSTIRGTGGYANYMDEGRGQRSAHGEEI